MTVLGLLLLALQDEGKPLEIELSTARTWAYQLQHLEEEGAIEALRKSRYDVLVLEPTRTHREEAGFGTKEMLSRLRIAPGWTKRILLAYISIGEAEDWRWYWTWSKEWKKKMPRPADWPAWIAVHDPDGWSGNYPVAFWDEAWKDIVVGGKNQKPAPGREYTSILGEVLADGFDGVYLDWVDAWEEETVAAAAKKAGKDPAKEMIALIGEIRAAGRAKNPGFLVVQQNGSGLLKGHPELLKVVDAIAQEDVWYSGQADVDWENPKGHDRKQEADFTKKTIEALQEFKKAGKPVFTVDYTVDHAAEVYARSRELGFVPYCSRTSLQKLSSTPPPGLAEKK